MVVVPGMYRNYPLNVFGAGYGYLDNINGPVSNVVVIMPGISCGTCGGEKVAFDGCIRVVGSIVAPFAKKLRRLIPFVIPLVHYGLSSGYPVGRDVIHEYVLRAFTSVGVGGVGGVVILNETTASFNFSVAGNGSGLCRITPFICDAGCSPFVGFVSSDGCGRFYGHLVG